MDAEKCKQSRSEIVEKYYDKLEEVWAYGKAHSPDERNGQEFKKKMERYKQEIEEIRREKMLILYPENF